MAGNRAAILALLLFTLIVEVFAGRYTFGEGKDLFYTNGVACEPHKALYVGESKANDVASIDRETKALEYTTDAKKWKKKVKEGTSKSGQTANLFMHTYNLALKPKFDKKLKIITDELTSTKNKLPSMDKFVPGFKKLSSTKTALQRTLKGLRFLSTKLAPALGVFGAVFTIVSGFFGGGEMEAVDLLRKEMHEGFKKIREEMNQKYLELKDYVDDSVQFAQVADLEAELEEMSTYFVNCVNEAEPTECVRNALRVIEANRFRYTNMKFAPTNNKTRIIKRNELMCEFYRRYVLVYVAAHTTALLALDDKEDIAIRDGYAESMDKEISDFKKFVEGKIKVIIELWQDKDLYKQNCLMTAEKLSSGGGKTRWKFMTGSYDWGVCIWEAKTSDAPDVQGICNMFDARVDYRKGEIYRKAKSFWQSYQNKLFSDTSIYIRIQKMAKDRKINNSLLLEIMSEITGQEQEAPPPVKDIQNTKKQLSGGKRMLTNMYSLENENSGEE